MYANQSDFESWMQQLLPALCAPPYPSRFVSMYTDSGGTLQLNQQTARAVASWAAVDKACLLDDRSTDTLAPQQCGGAHGLQRNAMRTDVFACTMSGSCSSAAPSLTTKCPSITFSSCCRHCRPSPDAGA
jgi:hypothetical protein